MFFDQKKQKDGKVLTRMHYGSSLLQRLESHQMHLQKFLRSVKFINRIGSEKPDSAYYRYTRINIPSLEMLDNDDL